MCHKCVTEMFKSQLTQFNEVLESSHSFEYAKREPSWIMLWNRSNRKMKKLNVETPRKKSAFFFLFVLYESWKGTWIENKETQVFGGIRTKLEKFVGNKGGSTMVLHVEGALDVFCLFLDPLDVEANCQTKNGHKSVLNYLGRITPLHLQYTYDVDF